MATGYENLISGALPQQIQALRILLKQAAQTL